ncbi:hypothetical protein V6Z11_A04G061500 [Gossypium hirsutum]
MKVRGVRGTCTGAVCWRTEAWAWLLKCWRVQRHGGLAAA